MNIRELKEKEYQEYLEQQRRHQIEQNAANIDYLSMMSGIDIPVDLGQGETENAQ